MQITMSVNSRIYQACQLDMLDEHYGLVYKPDPRPGFWFCGTVEAWRKLADDVDFRGVSGWSRDCMTRKSDGLHGRINKHLSKIIKEVAA
jgi:hypothetical protein